MITCLYMQYDLRLPRLSQNTSTPAGKLSQHGWLRSTVVERQYFAGKLSLTYA